MMDMIIKHSIRAAEKKTQRCVSIQTDDMIK